MASVKWRKALLPSLGSRRKDGGTTTRKSPLLASNTVADIQTTTLSQTASNVAVPPSAETDVDDRLVSDLLETTAEIDANSGGHSSKLPAQIGQCTRSQTVGAMSSSDTSALSSSPPKSHHPGRQAPNIPHKSSRRNLHSVSLDSPASSSRRKTSGLIRPLPKSQSVSSRFAARSTRRITQSSTGYLDANTAGCKRDSPIRKESSSPRKISHSVISALTSSRDYTDNGASSADSGGLLIASRPKTKSVFAKFADVLTDHFTTKNSRRSDKPVDTTEISAADNDTNTQQIVHGPPFSRLTLKNSPSTFQNAVSVGPTSLVETEEMEMKKPRLPGRSKRSSITASKRLTVVDEMDYNAIEDPFSESSSGQHTTEFEARLRSRQSNRGPTSTDPFQAEHILESSVDAMLLTPPVGCSTPRRRAPSLSRSETPTKTSRCNRDRIASLVSSSSGVSTTKAERQRKAPNLKDNPRKENLKLTGSRTSDSAIKKKIWIEKSVSTDSTRLSSFPPGSTIRRVPRSMGRLTEAPTLPVPAIERTRGLPLGRKKHPSPSKGQLELFGKVMENNLALGVFKDVDELAMSFNSPKPGTCTLSPRDANRIMHRVSISNNDLRNGYTDHESHAGFLKSRSRIPQPVRQLSRSRTDTAFVRDFVPASKGDSTAGDELQWNSSAYRIPRHRCNHCGSSGQIA